jgi:mono/diheme cytochrome c family protein
MARDLCGKNLTGFILSVVSIIYLGQPGTGWAQEPGEAEFNTTCFACHTIGAGRRVGPDLAGVTGKRTEEWLLRFIKSSQTVIAGGDADAVALAAQFPGLVMPDALLNDAQIRDVLRFIRTKSSSEVAGAEISDSPAVEPEPPAATEAEILAGQRFFQGESRFEHGGPACNACHDVRNDAVIGGGILAKELTTVFSRMGREGVKAILGQAPFPVMQAAYKGRELNEEEVHSLVAFLEFADSEEYNQLPRDYGIGLFLSGTTGAGILFVIFALVWRGRKVGSVNQAIYDRQIKSQTDGFQ